MDHIASKRLFHIGMELLVCMGYRAHWAESREKGETAFIHRNGKEKVGIREDVEAIVRFYSATYRVIPFEYRVDSRSGVLFLKRGYARPAKPPLKKRSIVV